MNEPPIMWDSMVREWATSHACHASVAEHIKVLEKRLEWQKLPPPSEGNYLVRCETAADEEGPGVRFVRLDYWDGSKWPRMGGYVTPTGWMDLPGV
jgi:hypothetical protein